MVLLTQNDGHMSDFKQLFGWNFVLSRDVSCYPEVRI